MKEGDEEKQGGEGETDRSQKRGKISVHGDTEEWFLFFSLQKLH